METNSVVLTVADNGRFNVSVVDRGVTTLRQFSVEAFAVSWALGQSLRLGVPVMREDALAPDVATPVSGAELPTGKMQFGRT